MMNPNPKRWLETLMSKKRLQQATKLMDEQCWCWGTDIRYPDGNLLLTYGFRRERAPSPSVGSNMYSIHLSSTRLVVLWGWGLFYGDSTLGGIFIGRNGFAPLLTSASTIPSPIYSSSDLPTLRIPASEKEYHLASALVGNALRWIAHYEEWLLPIAGESYRLACLAEWRKRPVEQLMSVWLWRTLAAEMETLLRTHTPVPRSA